MEVSMFDRDEHIEKMKAYVGWAYRDLKWFTEEEAQKAQELRTLLWSSLTKKRIRRLCRDTKISIGKLSRGCSICGRGTWSCLVVSAKCNADCFFCPRPRSTDVENVPLAAGLTFSRENDYIDYLGALGFEGVSFSGGEPTLVLDRLVSFLTKIRQRLGGRIYVWMYTNGIGLDVETLRILRGAGLDEIRFNIAPSNYNLESVELSRRFIDIVTVEIPSVPEHTEILKSRLYHMMDIGVDHLNLHQLHATGENYRNMITRDYTFLHYPSAYPVPIFESEVSALRLLAYALDQKLDLSIHYCSQVYKYHFQNAAARRRSSILAAEQFEATTEAGYIRRLTISQSRKHEKKFIEALIKEGVSSEMWLREKSGTGLAVHHSLLKLIRNVPCDLSIQYFDVQRISQPKERRLVSFIRAAISEGAPFDNLFSRDTCSDTNGQDLNIADLNIDQGLLNSVLKWEEIPWGAGPIF